MTGEMTATLSTSDDRTTLRMERQLSHPPAKVWQAVTSPAHLAHWFPCDVSFSELAVGAEMRFEFRAGQAPPSTGTITEVDPVRLFGFRWGEDEFRIELSGAGDGCLLAFTHTFGDHYGAASFAAGWDQCLAALASELDGRPAGPGSDMAALHERYIEELGLSSGTTTVDSSGWTIRFERQLTRPIDAVWAALAGGPVSGVAVPPGFQCAAVPAGPIVAADPPTVLEYAWAGGVVRWELRQGTGHGARLVLTQTGSADFDALRPAVYADWSTRVEALAAAAASAQLPSG